MDKFKRISNPLSIIAVFAGLAEIAGTVAIKFIAPELQSTFIWFVMAFPTLLVVLFFITLNFNSKVLYAPSDFVNEDNYMNLFSENNNFINNINDLGKQVESAQKAIVEITSKLSTSDSTAHRVAMEAINKEFKRIQERANVAQDSAVVLSIENDKIIESRSNTISFTDFQLHMINHLRSVGGSSTLNDISIATGISHFPISKSLKKLVEIGTVKRESTDRGITYSIVNPIA